MIQDASTMIRAGSMIRVAFDRRDDGFCRVIDLGASLQGCRLYHELRGISTNKRGYIDEQEIRRAIE